MLTCAAAAPAACCCLQGVVQDYIDSGLVHYVYDPAVPARKGTHGPQITVYERCLADHGSKCAGGCPGAGQGRQGGCP